MTLEYDAIIDDAIHSLLESHLETGINLSTWPEALALVLTKYPDIDVSEEGVVGGLDQDIYRLEVTVTNGLDSKINRVGRERALSGVKRYIDQPEVSYVTVVKEDHTPDSRLKNYRYSFGECASRNIHQNDNDNEGCCTWCGHR